MVPALFKSIFWVLCIYISYCLFIFLMQRQMMFPGNLLGPEVLSRPNISDLKEIRLKTSFGEVETWFLPPLMRSEEKTSPIIIFAHGNAELIDYCVVELDSLRRLGVGVLLVEFPGYGRSRGKPTQKNITETFEAAYDALIKINSVDLSRIILMGRSVGGGAVCALAQKRPTAAMILVSTFINTRSFAIRYLVPGFLARDPFDNLETVKNYHRPILIFHGKNDEIIPYKHGLTLYKAAKKGRLISYECGHNDCPPDQDEFINTIGEFLYTSQILDAPLKK